MRFIFRKDEPEMVYATAWEDVLTEMEPTDPEGTFLLMRHTPGIYLTNIGSINFLNMDYIKELGYQVSRCSYIPGSTTSIILSSRGIYSFSVFLPKVNHTQEQSEKLFITDLGIHIGKQFGLDLEQKGNDLVVAGTDRKIGGSGSYVSDKTIFTKLAYSVELPTGVDLNRLLVMPASKFEDKTVTTPATRASCFAREASTFPTEEDLLRIVPEYLSSLGLTVSESDFSEPEIAFCQNQLIKHRSSEWMKYGIENPSPDFT